MKQDVQTLPEILTKLEHRMIKSFAKQVRDSFLIYENLKKKNLARLDGY